MMNFRRGRAARVFLPFAFDGMLHVSICTRRARLPVAPKFLRTQSAFMVKHFFVIIVLVLFLSNVAAQQQPAPKAHQTTTNQATAQTPTQIPSRQVASNYQTDHLAEYGVEIAPEPRLIVVMAALEAAGWDAGKESRFRAEVRNNLQNLDPSLRASLQRFYALHKQPNATPAEQSAPYISLAYAIGNAPSFEILRSDDLPADVQDVLDFAPLVREFYRKSNFAERLPAYLELYRAEGERLSAPVAAMLRATLSYLHTRPITSFTERVKVETPSSDAKKKKEMPKLKTTVERERRFRIVPELLAASGAINLRVVGENYYAVVPFGIDPTASELRRAYLQYLVDPLISRANREIALKRPAIRQLLDERKAAKPNLDYPDIFTATARSLVAAADVRMTETARLENISRQTSAQLQRLTAAKNPNVETQKAALVKQSETAREAVEDESVAQLSDAYERGAVLAFYFAEQLKGIETSGFDIAASFADMVSTLNATRESKRLDDSAGQRARALAARRAAREREAQGDTEVDAKHERLIKSLDAVDEMLRAKKYTEAQERLQQLAGEFKGEPRIFFAFAQVARQSATDAFDQKIINERLKRALSNYRLAIAAASLDTDRQLIARAHVASGRILVYFEKTDDATKEFDAAIALGKEAGSAYTEAQNEKKKLTARNAQPKG